MLNVTVLIKSSVYFVKGSQTMRVGKLQIVSCLNVSSVDVLRVTIEKCKVELFEEEDFGGRSCLFSVDHAGGYKVATTRHDNKDHHNCEWFSTPKNGGKV